MNQEKLQHCAPASLPHINGLCDHWKSWGKGNSESNEELLCHLRVSQYTQETFVAGPLLAQKIS